MKAVLIENEPDSLDLLRLLLQKEVQDLEIVGEAGNIEHGKEIIDSQKLDLLFLDVELDDGTGFDLLGQISSNDFRIIFVTSYEKYAIAAIKAAALDYILKPLTATQIQQALNRFRNWSEQKIQIARSLDPISSDLVQEKTHIWVADGKDYKLVAFDKIVMIRAYRPYAKIIFSDGSSILSLTSLSEFQQLLPFKFHRIHRSYVINLDFVFQVDSDRLEVVLNNGERLGISYRQRASFMEKLRKMKDFFR